MSDNISVVVPVFNSYNILDDLYRRLTAVLHNNFNDYEVIMVDDGSSDQSYQKLKELNSLNQRIKIIKLDGNYGQQNALMCGFRHTNMDYIVTIDDDLQHLPEDIIKLYKEIQKGYEIVYGIPAERQQLFYRRMGSYFTDKVFNLITNKSSNIRVSSFRILKKSLLKQVIDDQRSFVYISAIILNLTDNIGNIEIKHKERKHGQSNYNFLKLVKLFSKLYIYYSKNNIFKLFRSNKPQYNIESKKGFKGE
jgi:undecaprenyl-phosphate 4-deoxy-4-formamido-L-arabinose transferase